MDWLENLQETIDFPMKYEFSCEFSHQSIECWYQQSMIYGMVNMHDHRSRPFHVGIKIAPGTMILKKPSIMINCYFCYYYYQYFYYYYYDQSIILAKSMMIYYDSLSLSLPRSL